MPTDIEQYELPSAPVVRIEPARINELLLKIGDPRTGPAARAVATKQVRIALADSDPLSLRAAPERVVVAGDWHGDAGWACSLLDAVAGKQMTVVLQVGDFGLWPGKPGAHFLQHLSQAAENTGTVVAFLDGNHEDFDQLLRYPVLTSGPAAGLRPIRNRIWHLPRNYAWQWSGVTMAALGGATSVDRGSRTVGKSWWPQEELTPADIAAAVELGRTGGPLDVLLTHDVPVGVNIDKRLPAFCWGDAELRRATQHRVGLGTAVQALAPSTLIHGHFHVQYSDALPLNAGGQCQVLGLDREHCAGNTMVLHIAAAAQQSSPAARAHALLVGAPLERANASAEALL